MRNWAIAFFVLAVLSGLACLGANSHEDIAPLRVLMVMFGALGAFAATSCRLQSRERRQRRQAQDPLNA